MATIQARRRKDGATSYTVRIRLKADGVIIHEETKTFDGRVWKRRDVERWAANREAALHAPGALHGAHAAGVTLAQAIRRYRKEYEARDQWGRSKRADLARLEATPLGRLPLVADGAPYLVFATQDGGSGVARYEVAESPGRAPDPSAWAQAESPYPLRDASLTSWIAVRAIDGAGNVRTALLPPPRADAFATLLHRALALLVLACLILLVYARTVRRPLR